MGIIKKDVCGSNICPLWSNSQRVLSSLNGVEVAIVIGHEPDGGAEGEREYNKRVAFHMSQMLRAAGAKVFYYEHTLKPYGARQKAMRKALRQSVPNCFIVWELHYDGYNDRSVAGHHFKYRGAKELAEFTQREFANRFPKSRARYDAGLHHCTSGSGAGFLKAATGWAILPEPFFITNDDEAKFFEGKEKEIAEIYCIGGAKFTQLKRNAG